MIQQVTVGVDPSGGDDEVGIVASALLRDGRFGCASLLSVSPFGARGRTPCDTKRAP